MQAPQAPVSNSGDDPSQSPPTNTVLSYCAKKSVAVASGLGAYFSGLGVFLVHRTARAAAQTLGAKGEAIDGSSAWLQGERNKFSKLNEKIDAYSTEAGVKKIDSEYIEQYLKRHSRDLDDTEKLRDAELQILLKQKLIEDLLREVQEHDNKTRLEASKEIASADREALGKINEVEGKNQAAMKYRLLSSLIFFGIFDVLDIVGFALDHFGGDFAKSVGEVVADDKVMSFFAESNKALKIDKVVEGLSRFPILYETNQSFVHLMSSEYLSPVSVVANEAVTSDVTKFLFNALIAGARINAEVDIHRDFANTKNDLEDLTEKFSIKTKENLDNSITKIANHIIERETIKTLSR